MISRGFGGKGGRRSMTTLRGGAGSGGNCLEHVHRKSKNVSVHRSSLYRVITFVAHAAGNGGGFSRMTTGGGVFGGVGRSKSTTFKFHRIEQRKVRSRLITKGGRGGG